MMQCILTNLQFLHASSLFLKPHPVFGKFEIMYHLNMPTLITFSGKILASEIPHSHCLIHVHAMVYTDGDSLNSDPLPSKHLVGHENFNL